MHDLSETTKRILDICAGLFFAAAAVTLNQVAVVVTIAAGVVSIACGTVRLLDRLRYGPRGASN
jgi:hypothetical protein